MKKFMSQAEYAKHRRVSRPYISKLKAKGILVMRGQFVDEVGSDAVLDDKPGPKPADGEPVTLADAKRMEAVYKAKRCRLNFERQSGKLVDAEEMRGATEARLHEDAEAILNFPSRISGQVAAELNCEEHLVYTVLNRQVRQFMSDRSRAGSES